jgi:TusA-related sulfurtransferase
LNDRSIVQLDMTGLSCPLPLLGAKKILDDLPDGQHMVLVSDCPGTGDDLRVWAEQTGHRVVHVERLEGRRVAYTLLRGRAAARIRGNVVVDLRGVHCPGPIVEAHRLLKGMQAGDVLVLISNCPGAPADVAAWADDANVRLIDQYQSAPGEYEFYLRKK